MDDKPDAWVNMNLGNLEDAGWTGTDEEAAKILGLSSSRMTKYRRKYPKPARPDKP